MFQSVRFWSIAVISSLLAAVVLFAYLDRKPLCIDSRLVEKIDIHEHENLATVYRCGLRRHIPYHPFFADISRSLSQRTQKVERFVEWMKPYQSKVSLVILQNEEFHFHVQGHEIRLSRDLLLAPGYLERGLLQVWLKEQNSNSESESPLFLEVWADFLFAAMEGDLTLQGARWPQTLLSYHDLCQDPWVSSSYLFVCQELSRYSGSQDMIDPMSLRGLLSQTLVKSFFLLTPEERIRLLKAYPRWIQSFSRGENEFYTLQSLNDSIQWSRSFIQRWQEALQNIHADWENNWSQVLADQGYTPDEPPQFDVLLVGTDRQMISEEIDFLKLNNGAIWDQKNKTLGWSQTTKTNQEFVGHFRARWGVIYETELQNFELGDEIIQLAKRVDRLLVVKNPGHRKINLERYFRSGVRAFAVANPDIKFAEFHAESLLYLVQKSKHLSLELTDYLSGRNKYLLKTLGAHHSEYDQQEDVFRVHSEVEAVSLYRL